MIINLTVTRFFMFSEWLLRYKFLLSLMVHMHGCLWTLFHFYLIFWGLDGALNVYSFSAVGGWFASLCVAGFTAIAVRKIVKTEMIDAEPMAKPSPFSPTEVWAWSGVFLISFVTALFYPTALGTSARTCLPFLLASTVLGYMVGSGYNFIFPLLELESFF